MPTILRLFADYSATALRLFRARAGSRAVICAQFRKEDAPLLWAQSLAAGHWEWLRAALARRAAGSAEGLRARARTWATVSRRRGGRLYLRGNCPLNARLCFRGIPIYPRYKRAVYARFRGYFAAVQKIAPENADILFGAVGTLRRWVALVGLEARRSCRRSEYLQRVQPPTAGAGDTPPSRRQRKAPAGFEPIGAGVYLELFAASMSIKNGMSRIYNRITRLPPPRALSPRAPSLRGRGAGG